MNIESLFFFQHMYTNETSIGLYQYLNGYQSVPFVFMLKRWQTDSSIYRILFHIPALTSAHISNLWLHHMLSTASIINFHQTCHTAKQCNHPAALLPCNHCDYNGHLMQMIIASIPKTTTSFILLLMPNYPISNPLSDGPKSLLLQHRCLIILVILYFLKILYPLCLCWLRWLRWL